MLVEAAPTVGFLDMAASGATLSIQSAFTLDDDFTLSAGPKL